MHLTQGLHRAVQLKPDDKIALAKKLGAADDVTADQATVAITAELARRDSAKV